MRRVLVAGASRGLGLEFVRQLLARGDRVLAACRRPLEAEALKVLEQEEPDRLLVRALDVADPASLAALAEHARSAFEGLDLLVNNAGVNVRGERFGTVAIDDLDGTMRTNAFGPFLLAQSLADLLARGKQSTVANISSQLGSISRTDSFYTPSYAISKAALNMATVLLSRALAASDVRVVALHPGWVKTDMGGAGAPVTPRDAVQGLLRVIDTLRIEDSGHFMDYQGHGLPW